MGKAEENKEKKRKALLSHAYALFLKKGISDTTISEIAAHAGVGKGTFYFYFKDKDEVVEKLIVQNAEQLFIHALEKLECHREQMSVEDKLILIADDLIEQLSQNKPLLKFINKNLNYGMYKQALLRDEVKSELDVVSMYRQIIESDGSRWKDEELMLYTIVELVGSTCHSIILNEDPVTLEYYLPYLHDCIRSLITVFRINT